MAKRLVCCPLVGSDNSFIYLYVDTGKLLVKDVTEELSLIDGDVRKRCCFDSFLDYARNDDVLPKEIGESIPFDFTSINSFEFFETVDELRLKTGSEKVLKSCILNYYRREYDGTQEYAHFSDPIFSNTHIDFESNVDKELTLEEKEYFNVEKEEDYELETLDKGKTDAEKEAEAARLEAETELQEVLQKAEKEAQKKKKQQERRKKRERELDQERYRFIRESDDVRNAEYQFIKHMEEEMRLNNNVLSSEYLEGNFTSLPGYISMDTYVQDYVNAGNECLEVPINNNDLYCFASRLEEMNVPYSVRTDVFADGTAHSVVCYTSDYTEQGCQAIELYTLEQELIVDNIINKDTYYSASQLCALKYANDNYIDTSTFASGGFNGEQIYCLTEASLKGIDTSVLANPDYSVSHMDAIAYFMENNWDFGAISDPYTPMSTVAECLNREEYAHGVPKEISYFELHDYDSFINYNNNWNTNFNEVDFKNFFDVNRSDNINNPPDKEISLEEFKQQIHESYIQIQKEMNWIVDDSSSLGRELNIGAGIDRIPQSVLLQLQTEEGRRGSGWTVTNYGSDGVKGNTSFLLYNGLRFDMATGACVGGKIKGFDMNVVPFNVLNDKQFNSMPKWNSGNENGKMPYNFNAGYTPTGYTKSDASFSDHKWFNKKEKQGYNSDRTNAANAAALPTGSPAKDKKPFTNNSHPLDELKVRSNYANRVGLIVQNRGSQILSSTVQMFKGPSYRTINTMMQMDESQTFSSYHKIMRTTGNIIFAAQLVSDVPRLFERAGQGVSYTKNAIANAGRWAVGNDTVKKDFKPLTDKAVTNHIKSIKDEHYTSLKSQYGAKAASMNIKDINRNLRAVEKEMKPLITANKALKDEINKLDPNKRIRKYVTNCEDVKKLLNKNKSLKEEIKTLQYKKGKTPAEREKLNRLVEKKKANEKLIGSKKQAIKQAGKIDRAKRDEILVKLAEKKSTEGKIKKLGIKKKELNSLKKKKKSFQKNLSRQNQERKKFAKKKGRMKQAPSRLAYSFVSQLNKAGEDVTIGGIATASSYAMSIARNPIANMLTRSTIRIIKKPIVKATNKAKKIVKNTKVYKNHITNKKNRVLKRKSFRQKTYKKVKFKLNKRIDKTLGINKAQKLRKFGNKSKKAFSKVNKTRKKVQRIASAPFRLASAIFSKISGFFSVLKAAFLKLAMYVAIFMILMYLLIAVIALISDVFTSFIMVGDETDDGRIDLAPYVEIVNTEKANLQDEITSLANGKNDAGKPYDNIFYDYNGKFDNNTLEILSMAYIRFDMDWETHKDDVEGYLKQLYADSNYVDAAASEPYYCANGCEERFYRCYNPYDEYATEERKALYKRSDHSGETWIGESASAKKGCTKTDNYSCKSLGHGTYNKNGCRIHNNGEAMSKACGCSDCKKVTTVNTHTYYYCQGYKTTSGSTAYHNNGKAMSSACSCLNCKKETTSETIVKYYCQGYCTGEHYDYYCPGHKETICKGEHQDLTITITTLAFDDIFYADTSFAENGAYIKGDAYDEKFTITAYCPCTTCCGPNATGTTASGAKAKANHTIAVDKSVIPLGTHVWIDGKEYVAEDTGSAIKGNRIDIFFNSHQEALNYGRRTKTVYKSQTVLNDGINNDKYGFKGWSEDNKEMARNIYSGLTDETAEEMYAGLDGITDLSYGSGTNINIDWDSFEFNDSEGLTRNQQKVVAVIKSNQIAAKKGYCQAWVSDVYAAAIGKDDSRCCANHAGEAWGASNDWGDIQVGATVYGYNGGNNPYGHVGIYIGNGMVAHNIGYVKVDSLEYWVTRYDGRCWGWNGGVNLTGKTEYNCKPAGTFMQGKD